MQISASDVHYCVVFLASHEVYSFTSKKKIVYFLLVFCQLQNLSLKTHPRFVFLPLLVTQVLQDKLAAGEPFAFTCPVKVSLIRNEEKNYLDNMGENIRVFMSCFSCVQICKSNVRKKQQ